MPCWTLNVTVFHIFIDALFRRWKLNRGPARDRANFSIDLKVEMSPAETLNGIIMGIFGLTHGRICHGNT